MQTLDTLRSKTPDNSIFVLANTHDGKVGLVVAVSKDLNARIAAPDLLNEIGPLVGAKGGGRADLARAGGGNNSDGVEPLLAAAKQWIRERLS